MEIWTFLGVNSGAFWAVYLGLLLICTGYNAAIVWMKRNGLEISTSLLVVFGVYLTLIGLAILSSSAAALTALLFTAAGLPMILGDLWREMQRRKNSLQAHLDELNER